MMAFVERCGSDDKCEAALVESRWSLVRSPFVLMLVLLMTAMLVALCVVYQMLSGMIQGMRKEAGFRASNVIAQVEGLLAT